MILVLAAVGALLALFPAILFWRNWRLYSRPSAGRPNSGRSAVSILIPARNEETGIAEAVRAALGSRGVDLEVIVLDDHSTDATAAIVEAIAAADGRVRLAPAPRLPDGWCGKQHACHVLSTLASHDLFAFLDADVRLFPDGLARAAHFLQSSDADLVSGIPLQRTETFLEKLLIPLIHFVLLGYLPIDRMRASASPAYGAGCGQFFLARRPAYVRAGGHAAIRQSLHDGIMLPRSFRRAGLRTDLFDGTDVATCRMYRTAGQVWRGLEKNAVEGMAGPAAIVPWMFILLGGQLMPIVLLVAILACRPWDNAAVTTVVLSSVAVLASLIVRASAAIRFRQSILGAVLHPLGILLLVAIQWSALLRRLAGRPAQWKGRDYSSPSRAESMTRRT